MRSFPKSLELDRHPNRVWFEGLLCPLDTTSEMSPSGSRGHRIFLSYEAARNALGSLIGMSVNWHADGGHDTGNKVGIITRAWIDRKKKNLHVEGFIYGHDKPSVLLAIKASADLGMSYEMKDARIDDMRSETWAISKFVFTGAAILPRTKAAYKTTRFTLKGGAA